jgi:hypothetical protein
MISRRHPSGSSMYAAFTAAARRGADSARGRPMRFRRRCSAPHLHCRSFLRWDLRRSPRRFARSGSGNLGRCLSRLLPKEVRHSHRRMGRRLCLLGGLYICVAVIIVTIRAVAHEGKITILSLPLPFSSARRTRSSPESSSSSFFADDDDAFAFFGQGDLGPLFSSFSSAISMSELDATLRAEAVLSLELLLAQRASSSDVVVVPRRPRHRKSCRHRRWVR